MPAKTKHRRDRSRPKNRTVKRNGKPSATTTSDTGYVVCIPSYKRAAICNEKTLQMLHKEGIPARLIYVYVADKAEEREYEAALDKARYGHLVVGRKGIVHQREFITEQWPEGKHLVLLDDDVASVDLSLFKGTSYKSKPTLHEFFTGAFRECAEKRAYMWGVYPVFNPFFRKGRNPVSYGLNYIIAAFHGIINRPKLRAIRLKVGQKNPYKEDVERSILYFKHDGVLVRYNTVGFRTKYYGTQGGLGTFEARLKPSKEAANMLAAEYGNYGDVITRSNGMTEFRLKKRVEE